MLTIRKFAELAGTTRRTLLFYDQEGVFKPAHIADNGYRYYSYDQLYQLKFILQLRHLDLPLATIKELLATNDAT
ncbi:MerR family transcriptional regulator [Levilactobacillus brevis]